MHDFTFEAILSPKKVLCAECGHMMRSHVVADNEWMAFIAHILLCFHSKKKKEKEKRGGKIGHIDPSQNMIKS